MKVPWQWINFASRCSVPWGVLPVVLLLASGHAVGEHTSAVPLIGRGMLMSTFSLIHSSDQIDTAGNKTLSCRKPLKKEIDDAERYAQADQVLASARVLRRIVSRSKPPNLNFTPTRQHCKLLDVADQIEATILELASPPDPLAWIKLREVHDGKRDIIAHYKLDEKKRLTGRIEFLIDKSLLVPLLAVLVETELYNTWVPRWHFPQVGIRKVTKIAQTGRTNQVIHVELEIPWKRDAIIASTGIEDVDASGLLGIHLGPLEAYEKIGDSNVTVPEAKEGVERVNFEGCFIFQKCPYDHPVLGQHSSEVGEKIPTCSHSSEMVLVGLSMFVDAKLSNLFPQWIAQFIIRIAMMQLFRIFIGVAEDIHAGKRPDHSAAIEKRRDEIYDWIDQRVNNLLGCAQC